MDETTAAEQGMPSPSISEAGWLPLGKISGVLEARDQGPWVAYRASLGRQPLMLEEQPEPVFKSKAATFGSLLLDFEGQSHLIRPSALFTMGSGDDNDLVIDDDTLSDLHLSISCDAHGWQLTDYSQCVGNYMPLSAKTVTPLRPPVRLRLGRHHFTIRVAPKPTQRPVDLLPDMIAESPQMQELAHEVLLVADSKEPVLITGPSGSGKELIASALHKRSKRWQKPFLALNCGALSASLIESELFGYEKGAFTGALQPKKGAFEAADGGTLFLDEIGELPLELQPKLLRVLETGEVRRVGGTESIPVDTRIVAATHRNLVRMVRARSFREDLFHRLFVITMVIPSLKERPEDLLPLAEHFLQECSDGQQSLSPSAKQRMMAYSWPGNIRELRNLIVRSSLRKPKGRLEAEDLRFLPFQTDEQNHEDGDFESTERDRMLSALRAAHGNRAEAARRLRMSKSTFHDRLKRYGVPPKFQRDAEE